MWHTQLWHVYMKGHQCQPGVLGVTNCHSIAFNILPDCKLGFYIRGKKT